MAKTQKALGLFIRFQPIISFGGDAFYTSVKKPEFRALRVSFPLKYLESMLSGAMLVHDLEIVCRKHDITLSSITQVAVGPEHSKLNDLLKALFSEFLSNAFKDKVDEQDFVRYIKALPPPQKNKKKDEPELKTEEVEEEGTDEVVEEQEPKPSEIIETIEEVNIHEIENTEEKPKEKKESYSKTHIWQKRKKHEGTIATLGEALEIFLHNGHC